MFPIAPLFRDCQTEAVLSVYKERKDTGSKEGHMCPVCIASTAVMVAGAGSTGGILAVCIGKFRKVFRADHLSLFQKIKEK